MSTERPGPQTLRAEIELIASDQVSGMVLEACAAQWQADQKALRREYQRARIRAQLIELLWRTIYLFDWTRRGLPYLGGDHSATPGGGQGASGDRR